MKLSDIKSRYDLPQFLNKNNLLGIGAEMGVKRGAFSSYILDNWEGELLYSIDSWASRAKLEKHYPIAIRVLSEYGNRSKIIKERSIDAAKIIENNSLDFCYIDGGHKYEQVKEDLNSWWPKIKTNGVFCGHDYSIDEQAYIQRVRTKNKIRKKWPSWGVKKAVDEFCEVNNIEKIYIDKINRCIPTSWYILKNV
tara:strand:- start:3169 stop:3753 length:585 start_codon:yes stop_codon:yes gene_type:complete